MWVPGAPRRAGWWRPPGRVGVGCPGRVSAWGARVGGLGWVPWGSRVRGPELGARGLCREGVRRRRAPGGAETVAGAPCGGSRLQGSENHSLGPGSVQGGGPKEESPRWGREGGLAPLQGPGTDNMMLCPGGWVRAGPCGGSREKQGGGRPRTARGG